MCPIRHFKDIVKFVSSYQNFVFAADTTGKVGIFLINENDLENDDESMQSESLEFPGGVEYMRHHVWNNAIRIVIVTGTAAVHTIEVEQTGAAEFRQSPVHTVQL